MYPFSIFESVRAGSLSLLDAAVASSGSRPSDALDAVGPTLPGTPTSNPNSNAMPSSPALPATPQGRSSLLTASGALSSPLALSMVGHLELLSLCSEKTQQHRVPPPCSL